MLNVNFCVSIPYPQQSILKVAISYQVFEQHVPTYSLPTLKTKEFPV